MKRIARSIIMMTLISGLGSVSAYATDVDVKPGEWEWTVTMEIANMPLQMPATVYTSCISKKDFVPQKPEESDTCKIVEQSMTSSGVQWKMVCESEKNKMESVGKIEYKGDTAKGDIMITTQDMAMKSDISGKRIGECSK